MFEISLGKVIKTVVSFSLAFKKKKKKLTGVNIIVAMVEPIKNELTIFKGTHAYILDKKFRQD